jgi:peptidoglycan-associated lipoprotein
MRMVNVTKLFASGLMISLLVACSNQHKTTDTSTVTQKGTDVTTDTVDSEQVFTDDIKEPQKSIADTVIAGEQTTINTVAPKPLADIIYFDFDQSTIRGEFHQVLDDHAAFLRQNPSMQILLEGHADERGTREYNMALAEHRGHAVSRYLAIQGVPMETIEVISYGEERPINAGRNEASWAENRRVKIRYVNR